MAKTRDDFLSDCNPEDKEAYEKLFTDLEDLARELGDPDPDGSAADAPSGEQPVRLRIAFDTPKGAALRLVHMKLGAAAPLLWFFPSKNEQKWTACNRVSAMLAQLPKAGVSEKDTMAFAARLRHADFVPGGNKVLKTATAGETDGISRVFRWDSNRAGVVSAVRALVEKVNAY
jgi:hypothetical protein